MNDIWKSDILGPGFEMRHVDMDDDYAGHVRCTVIRRHADTPSTRGVLYVHGFSDYFFQKAMADTFAEHGYAFYAVDLRRYGRSLMSGDKMFRVRDLTEYFPDIEAGISAMKEDGITEIIIMGHSTGGLTTTLYMEGHPDPAVRGLILTSPFLTWNLSPAVIKFGIPVMKLISRISPHLRMDGDGTNRYAATLARHLGGEWEYDTSWKPDVMPPVTAEWVRAIDDGQRAVRRGTVKVPVLFMHSDKSAPSDGTPAQFATSDAVLNVNTMAKVGRKLGPDVTEVTIPNGLHDLVLSPLPVRTRVYTAIFSWLKEKGL